MDTKTELTLQFLAELGLPTDIKNFKKYLYYWWKNPRKNGECSFALTDEGYHVLSTQIGLKFYEIDLPDTIKFNNQLIIWLDRFIDCPYYLTKKSIMVSREKVAVQLILFSGDLHNFGRAKHASRQSQID
jgi:hypothetical protein